MKKKLPTSDQRRLAALVLMQRHYADAPQKVKDVVEDMDYELDELEQQFRAKFKTINAAESVQSKKVAAKDASMAKAYLFMRHYLEGFISAVEREEYTPELLKLFTLSAKKPTFEMLRTDTSVYEWCEIVKSGIEELQEQGEPELARPTDESVLHHINVYLDHHAATQSAKGVVQDAREAMKPVRKTVNAFLSNVTVELNHYYRKLSDAQIRNKMRLWGVEFSLDGPSDKAAKDQASMNDDAPNAASPGDFDDYNPEVDDDIGIDEDGVS